MFAKVPQQILKRDDPIQTHIFCKIYMLEFQGRDYNLKKLAENTTLTYRQCRSLRKLAIQTINKKEKR